MTRQTVRQGGWGRGTAQGALLATSFAIKCPSNCLAATRVATLLKSLPPLQGNLQKKETQKKKDNELWVSFLPLCLFCSTYACSSTSSSSSPACSASSSLLHNELSMQKTLELSARFISAKETTLSFAWTADNAPKIAQTDKATLNLWAWGRVTTFA